MHCPHCKSLMAESRKTTAHRSEEIRFECPACGGLAVTVRPAGCADTRVDPVPPVRAPRPSGRHYRFVGST